MPDISQCPFCELRFPAKWELKAHLESDHPGRIVEKDRSDGEVIIEDSDTDSDMPELAEDSDTDSDMPELVSDGLPPVPVPLHVM